MGTSNNTGGDDIIDAFNYTLTDTAGNKSVITPAILPPTDGTYSYNWIYNYVLSDDSLRRSIVLQLLSKELIDSMSIDDLIKTARAVYKENNLQVDLSIGSSNEYDFVLKNGNLEIVSGNNRDLELKPSTEEVYLYDAIPFAPTVLTLSVEPLSSTSAYLTGDVVSNNEITITSKGFVYNTTGSPVVATGGTDKYTTNGYGLGSFSGSITDLLPNTSYYFRAYALNGTGISYGDQLVLSTIPIIWSSNEDSCSMGNFRIIVNGVTRVDTTATSGGTIWVRTNNIVTVSMDSGTCDIAKIILTGEDVYYGNTTIYSQIGASQIVTSTVTLQHTLNVVGNTYLVPIVDTLPINVITNISATGGGSVSGSTVTARGIAIGTSGDPTISGIHTHDGSGDGTFSSSLSGLTTGITYYVRAYATYAGGTVYGENETFKIDLIDYSCTETYCTMTSFKIVREDPFNGIITVIDTDQASSGQFIIKSGNVKITTTITVGNCETSNLAINGVTYTAPLIMYPAKNTKIHADLFSQLDSVVDVETTIATNVGAGGAIIGGIVTSTGVTILSRGSCWVDYNTTGLTTTNCLGISDDGSGVGTFTKNLTGLTYGTIYYHRAYAVTAGGTIYGKIEQFPYYYEILDDGTADCGNTYSTNGDDKIHQYNTTLSYLGGVLLIDFVNGGGFYPPAKLEIIHDGNKKATTSMTESNNSGPFDNYANIFTGHVPSASYAYDHDQYVLNFKGQGPTYIPTRANYLLSETGIDQSVPGPPNSHQLVWWQYTADDFTQSNTATIKVTPTNNLESGWSFNVICTSTPTIAYLDLIPQNYTSIILDSYTNHFTEWPNTIEYKMNSNKTEISLLEYSVYVDAASAYSLYYVGLYTSFSNTMTVINSYALTIEVYADASISGGDVYGGTFLGRYYNIYNGVCPICTWSIQSEFYPFPPPTIVSYIPSVTGFKTFIVKILTSTVNTVDMKIEKIVLKKVSP